VLLSGVLVCLAVQTAEAAELKKETSAVFDRYIGASEGRIEAEQLLSNQQTRLAKFLAPVTPPLQSTAFIENASDRDSAPPNNVPRGVSDQG